MSGRFEGKVAVVTGGASGLGEAVARALAAEGASVVVLDLDGAAAQAVAGAITADGGEARAVQADVRRASEVEAAMAGCDSLDVLVLSAAVEERAGVTDCTDEQWDRVLETNLKGPFLCLKAALPKMVASGGGSVVALGSTLGLMVAPGYPAYASSKAALVNLCKQGATEVAADGVRINVVAPSATTSGLFMRVTAATDDPEAARARVAAGSPMRRLGSADEVTEAVLFLASDAASYISGTVMAVDGGMAAMRL